MTLDKFNYLQMLCEERNVTKAANRLFITQPTLTAFLNNLERSLGFKIFDRTRNPVLLTPNGKVYMEQMRRLLLEETKLVEDLRRKEQASDTISIGIGQIHSELLCPQLVQRLLRQCPGLNILLWESQEERLLEALRKEEVDLILGHVQVDTVNFHFEPICEERIVLAIPENWMPAELLHEIREQGLPMACETSPILIRPEILADIPMIRPTKTLGSYLNLKQMMELYHIPLTQTIQTTNMVTAASMVQLGLGYMYISPTLFRLTHVADPQPIYYCTLPRLARSRKYYIGYRTSNPNKTTILRIKEILRELMEETPLREPEGRA